VSQYCHSFEAMHNSLLLDAFSLDLAVAVVLEICDMRERDDRWVRERERGDGGVSQSEESPSSQSEAKVVSSPRLPQLYWRGRGDVTPRAGRLFQRRFF